MPGASAHTRRVKILNANWKPEDTSRGAPGGVAGDGRFEVMVVTEDDQQYFLSASPGAMTALVALARADTVMAWDPENKALIIANIVGTMPWTADSSA